MTVSQLTLEDLLRPLREETVSIAKENRYGEGVRKIEAWLRAHPGWQRAIDIINGTGQVNLTARISEARRCDIPIVWNGQPRDSRYRLNSQPAGRVP